MNYLIIKRGLDFLFALFLVIAFSPIIIIIMILIKIDSKGPIFFKQERIGRFNKRFCMLKFRTMRIDAPKDTPTHLLVTPEKWITRLGKILRKTSLDELPQIINILIGDMSFIGPRPALWNQFDLTSERGKHNVQNLYPGLTGYAQINGRDTLSIIEKVKMDAYYVEHINFRLDLKIFIKTIIIVLKMEGILEGMDNKNNRNL